MPTYSYVCSKCGLRFDKVEPMKEWSHTKSECPYCKGEALRSYEISGIIIAGGGTKTRRGSKDVFDEVKG